MEELDSAALRVPEVTDLLEGSEDVSVRGPSSCVLLFLIEDRRRAVNSAKSATAERGRGGRRIEDWRVREAPDPLVLVGQIDRGGDWVGGPLGSQTPVGSVGIV